MTGSLTEKGIQFSKKAKSHQVTEEGRGVNWVSITADDRYVLFHCDASACSSRSITAGQHGISVSSI